MFILLPEANTGRGSGQDRWGWGTWREGRGIMSTIHHRHNTSQGPYHCYHFMRMDKGFGWRVCVVRKEMSGNPYSSLIYLFQILFSPQAYSLFKKENAIHFSYIYLFIYLYTSSSSFFFFLFFFLGGGGLIVFL